MMIKLIVLSALVAVAAASPVHLNVGLQLPRELFESKDSGNANFYVDLVLLNLNRLLPEQVDIPDVGTALNLHNCYVFGLGNGLHRSGDATMVTVENTVKFSASFNMKELGASCKWRYTVLSGGASGSTEVVDISAAISVELTSGSSPVLTEFRVVEIAPVVADVTGLTILFNWLIEDIADVVINSFGDQIIYVVEHNVKDLLQLVLDQIVIP